MCGPQSRSTCCGVLWRESVHGRPTCRPIITWPETFRLVDLRSLRLYVKTSKPTASCWILHSVVWSTFQTRGSYGNKDDAVVLLGCDLRVYTVSWHTRTSSSGRHSPTFHTNLLSPSSGWSSETSTNINHTTQCNFSEDSHLHSRCRENLRSYLL
jgi:hypothetical protein